MNSELTAFRSDNFSQSFRNSGQPFTELGHTDWQEVVGTLAGMVGPNLPIQNPPPVARPSLPRLAPWISNVACFITRHAYGFVDLLWR
jgi:hypothetical protein